MRIATSHGELSMYTTIGSSREFASSDGAIGMLPYVGANRLRSGDSRECAEEAPPEP